MEGEARGFISSISETTVRVNMSRIGNQIENQIENKFISKDQIMLRDGTAPSSLIISKDQIMFRDGPAPSGLISMNTQLRFTLENGKAKSVCIDPNICIQITYGSIKSFSIQTQMITIGNSIENYEVQKHQIKYLDGRILHFADIGNMVNAPVQIFINGDAFLEAKVLTHNWRLKLNFDNFKKVNNYYTWFKDHRLIPHFIETSLVFYQNSSVLVEKNQIENMIGKECEIVCEAEIVKVEVGIIPPPHTSKADANLLIPLARQSKSEEGYVEEFKHVMPQKSKLSASQSQVLQKNVTPVSAKRIILGNMGKDNFLWYTKDNNVYSNSMSGTLLVGLLEVCYRFPNYQGKAELYQRICACFSNVDHSQEYQIIINSIFQISRAQNNPNNLETFYQIIDLNHEFLSSIASILFPKPRSFALLSNELKVCFYVLSVENQVFSEEIYAPMSLESNIPVVSLYEINGIFLIYSEKMMEFDGYCMSTLDLLHPKNIQLCWPLTYTEIQEPPNYLSLINNISDLTMCSLASREKKLENIITGLIHSLKYIGPMVESQKKQEFYSALEGLNKVALSLNACRLCQQSFTEQINVLNCQCAYCDHCMAKTIIEQSPCGCGRGPSPDEIREIIEKLRQKGFFS